MKAWVVDRFGVEDFGGLRQVERPDPAPGAREIVVRIRAVSLNFRDLMVTAGDYPARPGIVPVSDGAGEVIAVGANVTRVKVGDRVAPIFNQYWIGGDVSSVQRGGDLGGGADGVLAEQVVLSEEGVVLLPDALGFEDAAALPCAGVTAWSALMAGRATRAGDTVLVQGSGGVSVFALQLAKALGARVIATTSSATKAERLRALGADAVIDYKAVPDWGATAKALTGGEGVDRVVEVGGPGTFQQSIAAVRRGGCIGLVGLLGGPAGEINPLQILLGQMAVFGITVGSRGDFEALLAAISANRIAPVIDRTFAFAEAPDAYRHLAEQKHFGKVVIGVG